MSEAQPSPRTGATRFTDDGKLEVFDGTAWDVYEPPVDDGFGAILKGFNPSVEKRHPTGDNDLP